MILQSNRSIPAVVLVLSLAFVLRAEAGTVGLPAEVRNYDVNYVPVGSAPTIDGVEGAGEWNAAAGGGDDFRLLREVTAPSDTDSSRFRMLWNENGLYIIYRNDQTSFLTNISGGQIDFGADVVNFYFDPNVDGELNFPAGFGQSMPFDGVDGYQVAVNLFSGSNACNVDETASTADDCSIDNRVNPTDSITTGSSFGVFTEAHVNTLFGNQAEWAGLRQAQIATEAGAGGGLIEMLIPWGDFDALAQLDDNGTMVPTGLNHPNAPMAGDVWFFQLGVLSTDLSNFLPIWNWHTGQFFASHPHGTLTFGGSAVTPDFNGDGANDCADLDLLSAEISAGTNDPTFDLNGDGVVNTADLASWQSEAGDSNLGASYLSGDFNLDGVVDGLDFIIWNASKFTTNPAYCSGDANADGLVDGQDFIIWNANKFSASAP
ncbi:MAG: hypothetical protein ACPGXK_13400, partial [Phycisphaerae bacterium]